MYFCAACGVKNCANKMGEEGEYPKGCPSLSEKLPAYLEEYQEPLELLMAQKSAVCAPDHSECRILKTIRFAKECGFHKIGLAFCVAVEEQARQVAKIFQQSGLEVESVICKVGHVNRSALQIEGSRNAMCNPIAQAELLNEAGTQLNVVLGLCVGHDSLFIRHSNAPVTVLAAKDHVYDHAPLEYLKHGDTDGK